LDDKLIEKIRVPSGKGGTRHAARQILLSAGCKGGYRIVAPRIKIE
jgi:hypothetical protein